MSSDNHMNNSEKEVDEVDAALSDLEITLEGGKTSNTLVASHPRAHTHMYTLVGLMSLMHCFAFCGVCALFIYMYKCVFMHVYLGHTNFICS